MKILITLLLTTLLTSCEFELSPWQTDAHCPGVSINENIARLQAFETEVGIKHFYQVAIISDPQQYPGSFESTIELINDLPDVDFILLLGDLAQSGVKAEFEWICGSMAKARMPIFAVIGNHDGLSFGKDIWQDVFGPLDFSFSYQGSKFVAYNDNQYEFENVPDRNWIEQQAIITDQSRILTIAASHIMPWENDLEFEQQLKDNGYDLTLHGHVHYFDFWQYQSVQLPHFITTQNRGKHFGLLSIYSDASYQLEFCSPTCSTTTVRIKNKP